MREATSLSSSAIAAIEWEGDSAAEAGAEAVAAALLGIETAAAEKAAQAIAALEEAQTGVLTITFVRGQSYQYPDVSLAQYHAFASAPSPGRWYHANLRGR
jgi:hypothetical protein